MKKTYKATKRRWYLANKEKSAAYSRKYYSLNKAKHNAAQARWRAKNKDKILEYNKRWYYGESGRAWLERTSERRSKYNMRRRALYPEKLILASRAWTEKNGAAYKKEWNEKNKDKVRAAHRLYYYKSKEKNDAWYAVEKAVKSGAIVKKPCEKCKTKSNVRAVHNDYKNPLDINWLCLKHHRERYRKMPSLAKRAAWLAKSI
jgi:hypothetical protein